jgi:LacI family transcriptional regulator
VRTRKRVTIREVAAETGLALSTVSNALAGKAHVKQTTRDLVQAAAERLGYRASRLARALRSQRSSTIGVLVADIGNPASPDFVRGIEDVAIAADCNILLCNTDGIESKQISQMHALLDRQVDGMILISQHTEQPAVRALLDGGTPYVLIQRRSRLYRDDYVGSDNSGGIALCVRYIAGLGHRRIGFVRGPAESSTAVERLEAFEEAVQEFSLDDDPDLVFPGDYSSDAGYRATQHFFALARPPTAILASNDVNALGVLEAAHELRIDVPGALSVIGWDDIEVAALKRIDLTTLHLPKREMGRAAAELLMRSIRAKRRTTPREIIVPTRLVVRGSCAAPRAEAAIAPTPIGKSKRTA